MKKYKEIIMYLIFGVLTTVVNWIVYIVLSGVLNSSVFIANVCAWVISVLFAFVTNKIYVFNSNSLDKIKIIKELTSFVGARIVSGVIEIFGLPLLMLLGIDQTFMNIKGFWAKVLISIIVIILNYVFSKFLVFNKDSNNKEIFESDN